MLFLIYSLPRVYAPPPHLSPENRLMGLYSEDPAIVVKRKEKLTNAHVQCHNIFGVLRYVSKRLIKIITNKF